MSQGSASTVPLTSGGIFVSLLLRKPYLHVPRVIQGFLSGASGEEPACQSRRRKKCRLDPWVGKIPRRKAWQPTPIFFFSSTSLLRSTHLPRPSCTCAQSCNPVDCSLPGSSVHGLFQARILDGLPFPFPPLQYFCLENPRQRSLVGYSP